ncbi:S49 family peptidase [Flavobacterium rhizosphaerae]|uniref:S49 family peptidase n=1 Tax=Flavobacterium rhizosphaerae TaxID=3163298 RepID=A0ABW8Z005_9FLAO
MKSNPLINDLSKGYWAMTFEGISFWAPFANKLMSGELVKLDLQAGSLVQVFDENLRYIAPEEDGHQEVPPGSVAVISMVGALIRYGDWCIYGADDIVKALDEVERNENFIGAVVYFDGPGGAVNAIPPFQAFAARKTKTYVGVYELCCSAHLFAAYTFCDYLMAENTLTSTIGSIGVVFSVVDNRKYLESLGYKFHEIYPDESEDKNLAFRLAMEGKYEMIKKEMLSPLATKFQDAVRAARPKLKEAPGVLTGKTFFTEQAIEYGLTDGVGTIADGIRMVQIKSEIKSLYK